MLYTSLYSFSPSPPDFLVTPSHSLNPLVSDSRFSSQPQFSFFFLIWESHPIGGMPTASLAFSPVSFTSLTSSHWLPNHMLVFITCQSSTSEIFTSKSHPVTDCHSSSTHCPLTLFYFTVISVLLKPLL